MASITVRNLDERVRLGLRVRAARNGRSMEAEVREILGAAVDEGRDAPRFADDLFQTFRAAGGVELELPERRSSREPPDLS